MLGTPFQFGKPIQFSSDTAPTGLPGWKRVPQHDTKRIEAFRPSVSDGSLVATKPTANRTQWQDTGLEPQTTTRWHMGGSHTPLSRLFPAHATVAWQAGT